MRRAIPVLLEILYVGAVTLLLRAESDSPDGLEETPEPARSWWVEFEKDDGSIGCPNAVVQSLVWLLVHHRDDGTWGDGRVELEGRTLGKTGLTALALLPFLGAGYLPTSKDIALHEGGEWCYGREISRGLDWLRRDQREDGSFRSAADESFDQILAAFALSETYGLTAQDALRKPAQDAVDAMIRLQKPDGSWEGAGPTAWAIVALSSAKQSELAVDPKVLDRALHCDQTPGHPGEALARILSRNRAADAVERLRQESADRDPGNLAWWYLATMATWAHDGARGKREGPGLQWRTWSPAMKEKLVPLMRKDGSIEGKSLSDTVARTCLWQLTLEVYYRYAYVFAPR